MPPKLIEARFVPSQHGFWKGKGQGCLEALREEFPLKYIKPTATMRMTYNAQMTDAFEGITPQGFEGSITKKDLEKIAKPDHGASASKLWLHTVSRTWPSKMANKTTGIWGYNLDFLNFAVKGIDNNTPVKRKWMERSPEEQKEIVRRCTLLKNVFAFIGANDKDRRQNLMKQLSEKSKKKNESPKNKQVVNNFVTNSLVLAEDDTITITLYHRPDDDGKERPPFNIKMFRWWSNSKREMTGEGAAKRATSLRKAFEWYEDNLENIEYWFDFNQKIIWPVALLDTKAKGGWNTIKTLKIEKLYPKEKNLDNFGFDAGSFKSSKAAAARDKNRSGEYVDHRGNPPNDLTMKKAKETKETKETKEEKDKAIKEAAARSMATVDGRDLAVGAIAKKKEEEEEETEAEVRGAKRGKEFAKRQVVAKARTAARVATKRERKREMDDHDASNQFTRGGRRRRGGTKRRRNSKHRKSKRRKNSKKIRKKARKSKRRKSRRKKKSKKRRR